MALDPTNATAKWLRNMQGAGTQITEGVNAVTTAPGQKAAAQAALWLQKIQASQQKWARNVAAVSLQSWQQAMIERGIPNISAGVTAKQGNYLNFANKFYPWVAQGVAKVKAMPKNSLADGIQRAVTMIQWNAGYTGGNGRS